jgi:hypothetical protein
MPEKAKLAQLSPYLVDHFWPIAEPYLRRAQERMGGQTTTEIYDRIKSGQCDLWGIFIGPDMVAAAITSIRGDTAYVETVGGGKMKDWVNLLIEFERLAKQHGKTRIEIEGRSGWAKLLPAYDTRRIVLGRAL